MPRYQILSSSGIHLPSQSARRIAIVCLHTCPWQQPGKGDAGGMNVYVRETSLEWVRQGWQVDVFTRSHSACSYAPDIAGLNLVHVPAGPVNTNKDQLHHYLAPFVAGVMQWIAQNRSSYRVIMSHYWLSGLAALELSQYLGLPLISAFHTLAHVKQLHFPLETAPQVRVQGEIRLAGQAAGLLANSEHEKQMISEFLPANPESVTVASPGVDSQFMHAGDKAEARQKLHLPQAARITISVGRDTKIKGMDILLQALDIIDSRDHPDPIVALLLGPRPSRPSNRIRLIDPVPHAEIRDYFVASDVCVVPSRYESFGMVAQEAIACGCPVVASRVGGLPSIVRDGVTGLLATPGDAQDLADCLQKVLLNPDRFYPDPKFDTLRPRSWAETTRQMLDAIIKVTT
jgi:D-inositol-3-phosphate glycosyltransferase